MGAHARVLIPSARDGERAAAAERTVTSRWLPGGRAFLRLVAGLAMPQLAPVSAAPSDLGAVLLLHDLVADMKARSERLKRLEQRLLEVVGSPLLAFVDHLGVPAEELDAGRLRSLGFHAAPAHPVDAEVFRHRSLTLPAIYRLASGRRRLAVSVDDVADFLVASGRWTEEAKIEGDPFGGLRRARLAESPRHELWVVERRGARGFTPRVSNSREISAAMRTREAFRRRPRYVAGGDDAAEVERMGRCAALIQHGRTEFGPSRAAALFVEAELERFSRRNRAGRILESRLRTLGVGFSHVDHLVYRSSRHRLRALIRIFELLGFERRQSLSTGAYGAERLDHPELGLTVIVETDLLEGEADLDFSLRPGAPPGPIERYTLLHGESILGAGIHRLVVVADLERARAILESDGVHTYAHPSRPGSHRAAVTSAEPWLPDVDRVAVAIERGALDPSFAIELTSLGAPGSELGLVERADARRVFDAEALAKVVERRSHHAGKVRSRGIN